MIEFLPGMAALDSHARIAMLERELHWAHLKIQVWEERLRQQRIKMLGPFSETLSDLKSTIRHAHPAAWGTDTGDAADPRGPYVARHGIAAGCDTLKNFARGSAPSGAQVTCRGATDRRRFKNASG
jgi:hypothetical protein